MAEQLEGDPKEDNDRVIDRSSFEKDQVRSSYCFAPLLML